MTTLANINPQEVNPEGAESPLQRTPVQAAQGVEKTASQPFGSLDVDFAPEQPTSLAELNDAVECIHSHRAPLPGHTLLSISAAVSATQAQHFTVNQAVAVLFSRSRSVSRGNQLTYLLVFLFQFSALRPRHKRPCDPYSAGAEVLAAATGSLTCPLAEAYCRS